MSRNALQAQIEGEVLPFVLPSDIAAYNASLIPGEVPTKATTIAGIDVELPLKFYPGMILTDVTAKIADAHCQRQFANNRNAAFSAWEKKAKAWDESTDANKGERPANPCTAEALLNDYVAYLPSVGESQQTSLEKMRLEAGRLVWLELIDEHNALIEAKQESPRAKLFGTTKVAPKKGKGAAEEREFWVEKVLSAKSLVERVQTHIDRLVSEAKDTKPAEGVKELSKEMATAVEID